MLRQCVRAMVAVAIFAGIGPAAAADLPVKAPVMKAVEPGVNWTGFYVGGFVGGLWGQKDWREIVGPVPGGIIHPNYSGVIGGVQAGYNYQIAHWVFGVEGEWGWTNANGTSVCIVGFATCGVQVKWMAELTGRVGYAFDRALFYAKGGGAWVSEDYPVAPGLPGAITLSNKRDGWVVGGGIEYALTPNWSAKVEYNYYDFGTDRLNFAGAIEDITQRAQTVKLGANYRFGWR